MMPHKKIKRSKTFNEKYIVTRTAYGSVKNRRSKMQPVAEINATLSERMDKIEKHNRLLKGAMVVLVMFLSTFVLIGAKVGPNDGQFRKITAQSISIVGDTGQEVMLIGFQKELGTGIRIFNISGKRILGIGITPDGGGSGILVADKEGRPRIGLGMDEGIPSVAMTDENGKKILAMGGDAQGYGFVVMDANEVERAGLGFNKGDTGVVLYDDKGQYVRGMIREKSGTHYNSYVDENGEEIFER
jgi:hypothetical protein